MITPHFVLTRFNIASKGREAPIRNTLGWLDRRFDLFEKFCLPSMAAQTAKHFGWLIYFDSQTPEHFRSRIEEAQKIAPFEAVFVGPFASSMVIADIRERVEGQPKQIITTRLDNDDALAADFLQSVQEAVTSVTASTIVNFRDGVAIRSGKLFTASDHSNPFTSLVEDFDTMQTVWAAPHTELEKKFPVKQLICEPNWMQIIHGENVANRIKGRRLRDTYVLDKFALGSTVDVQRTTTFSLVIDRIALYPARLLREFSITLAKRLLGRGRVR